jgi:hypothetical protein
MTHEFMYPRVTQIALRAHGLPAGRLFSGPAAQGTAELVRPKPSSARDLPARASS